MFVYIHHILERLDQLWTRILGYSSIQVFVELALIWVVVFLVLRFLRGTRGARMLRGVGMVLIVVATVFFILSGNEAAFQRLKFLYGNLLTFASLGLIVVFQPELRRALVRLGETQFFGRTSHDVDPVIEQIVGAVSYLSRNKIGALVAIERETEVSGAVEGGTLIDGEVTSALLQTIFWPGSALHDLGVIIRSGRVFAAGVQFPLAEGEQAPGELGSRHRAAIGLSMEVDCLVVVVSEETGTIGLAQRGRLERPLKPDQLRLRLQAELFAALKTTREEEQALDGQAAV